LAAVVATLAQGAVQAQGAAKAAEKQDGTQSGHQRMLAELQKILAETDDANFLLGSGRIRRQKEMIAKLPENAKPQVRFALLVDLGDWTVYYGDEREGLAIFDQAFALPKAEIPNDAYQEAKIKHAAAWLRLAETENCCAYHNADSCILPLKGDAIHKKPEGSTNSVKLLSEVLAETPKDSPLHLRAQWFLNMGMMTLGKYPDAVPEADRLPWTFFDKGNKFPRFRNVASDVGIELLNLAGGSIAEDFDNDGDIDLMLTGYGADGQLEYFTNEGGVFQRRTEKAGIVGILGGLNCIQADYDNDGWIDVFIPRGAWLSKLGLQPDSLLHNNGDGTFTDRAFEAGLCEVNYPNITGAFADFDNDGDLDLYVANECDKDVPAPSQLFQNNGNGTFTDIGAKAGVTNMGYSRSAVTGDYDNDGDPDLWVANLNEDNHLYQNNGDMTFTDVAPKLGMTGPKKAYTSWFLDFDNDGNLDLHVNTFGASPADLAAAALGKPFKSTLAVLYKGDGKGGFKDVGKEVGLTEPYSCMGGNVGDFNNDGFQDFYAGTGRPEARDLVPDKAYLNDGGKRYLDITLPSGLGHVQKGHGRSFADFDNDGDLDVFAQMGGAFRADKFHNALYENPGFGSHWLALKLEGTKSNRCAIGVRIRADIVEPGEKDKDGKEGEKKKRSVFRRVSTGGSFGANPLRQQIGLGKAEKLERLEIYWPTSKTTQVFTDIPMDRFVHIVEGEAKPKKVEELRAVKLGAGR
jgi:VCBS repeat protein/ASPIC/UnbV protein